MGANQHSLNDGERINPRFEYDTPDITDLWVWIAVNRETQRQGLIHVTSGGYRHLLMAVSKAKAEDMAPQAHTASRYLNVDVKLMRYTRNELQATVPE